MRARIHEVLHTNSCGSQAMWHQAASNCSRCVKEAVFAAEGCANQGRKLIGARL